MSIDHEAEAAAALAMVQAVGDDAPGVAEFEAWVAERVGEDPPPRRPSVAHTPPEGVVARPGDVLIVSIPGATAQAAARVRDELRSRLPGIADVVIVPGAVTVYRPGAPTP